MQCIHKSETFYAVAAGLCAAAGSVCGKLSGMSEGLPTIASFFALMIVFNASVWMFFVKALQGSKSSLTATLISVSTNYFSSALLGFMLFGEITSALWWCGTFLVLIGLVLVTRS